MSNSENCKIPIIDLEDGEILSESPFTDKKQYKQRWKVSPKNTPDEITFDDGEILSDREDDDCQVIQEVKKKSKRQKSHLQVCKFIKKSNYKCTNRFEMSPRREINQEAGTSQQNSQGFVIDHTGDDQILEKQWKRILKQKAENRRARRLKRLRGKLANHLQKSGTSFFGGQVVSGKKHGVPNHQKRGRIPDLTGGHGNSIPRFEVDLPFPTNNLPGRSQTFQKVPSEPTSHQVSRIPNQNTSSECCPSSTNGNVPKEPRPIIMDGSNVAFAHGNGKVFSSRGLLICVNTIKKKIPLTKEIICFVPRFRSKFKESCDTFLLDQLEKDGILKYTPSREVNGKKITSYDDRYILEYAKEVGGIVISNDNYKDLYAREPQWRETIEKRLLQYTFVNDFLMFPSDPLGQDGPNLQEFCCF